MSTELLENNGIYLTRFFGGTKRGVCYQISVNDPDTGAIRYIQVTDDQMRQITEAYQNNKSV